jgi:signal transduction histidine kinase
VAVPYAFLAGLVRIQFFQMRALGALMTGLGDGRYAGDLPTAVAAAFDDVRVQVIYWLAERDRYVDEAGRPADLPVQGSGQAVLPIERDGRRLGAVIVDAAVVSERSQLITGLVGAVELAMDNQRVQAELRARVLELERSRAHVISAGEAQRRQLERNLHDGAQQLLVGLRLRLGVIRQSLATTSPADTSGSGLNDAGAQVDSAMSDLDAALAELRDLAHGLHPMLLSTRGLAAAVESLAARAPLPVHVDVRAHQRLPEAIESAAYFVIAEGLTNIAKHAAATGATVTVIGQPGRLLIEVEDNGIGGADLAGPGLQGLAARVAALDGHVRISTPAQGGTLLRAQIPLPPDRPGGSAAGSPADWAGR